MFEVDNTCTSLCRSCGTLCAAFPITDLTSLQLYQSHQCSVIVGDLYIMDLSMLIIRAVLLAGLSSVHTIRGSLYVENNMYIPSMTFFSNLQSIEGDVYYLNNPVLVDTRLPSLLHLSGNVTVIGCDRLCPARYTQVGYNAKDTGCTSLDVDYYLHVTGSVTAADVSTVSSIFTRLVHGVTSFGV